MKKLRMVVFIVTLALGVVVVVNIGILIFSPKSLAETSVEITALSISAVSVAIAIFTQISARRERNDFDKVIHELRAIDKEVDAEGVLEVEIREKLDEILAMDNRIYRRMMRESKQGRGKEKKA